MLHVCYDKDFVNMQISFLGLIQKFSKKHLKKAVVLHLIIWHIYKKSYLNTSQNSTNLVRCFVPVNSMVCTEYSKQEFVFKLLKRAKHAERIVKSMLEAGIAGIV